MVLMIDNYDSFTYNLVQYLRILGADVHVARNDAITIEDIERMAPSHIVISPGPGKPDKTGMSVPVIRRFSGSIPVLGVCLGHQAIGHAFGGTIVPAKRIMHGKTSAITTDKKGIFAGIPSPLTAMRYHSLVIDRGTLPECLKVCAEAEDGEIMGIRHESHPTVGIQFHPESIMTPKGKRILKNFLATQ